MSQLCGNDTSRLRAKFPVFVFSCRCGTCMVFSSPTTQTWGAFWQTTASRVTPSGRTSRSQDTWRWVLPATHALSTAASPLLSHQCVIHWHRQNMSEVVLAGCQWDRQDSSCAPTLKLCWILWFLSIHFFIFSAHDGKFNVLKNPW